jgi:hypothetical protein
MSPSGFSMPAAKRPSNRLNPLARRRLVSATSTSFNDVDGAVRQEPLLVNYYGKAVPSMALLAAAKSLNLSQPTSAECG